MQFLPKSLYTTDSLWVGLVSSPLPVEGHLLTEAEEMRAERFATAALRDRWRGMRMAVKAWIGQELDLPPVAVNLVPGEHGKPTVSGFPEFHCNISHSGDWLALAKNATGPVGVDIELPNPDFPFLEVAADFFEKSELNHLRQLSDQLGRRRFYEMWVTKEAAMKADGRGLHWDPKEICLDLCPERGVLGYKFNIYWKLAGGWHGDLAWAVAWL